MNATVEGAPTPDLMEILVEPVNLRVQTLTFQFNT